MLRNHECQLIFKQDVKEDTMVNVLNALKLINTETWTLLTTWPSKKPVPAIFDVLDEGITVRAAVLEEDGWK